MPHMTQSVSSACQSARNVAAAGVIADMSLRGRSCLRARGSGGLGLREEEKVQECQCSLKRRLQTPSHARRADLYSVLG